MNNYSRAELAALSKLVHKTAVEKGWHEKENTDRTYRMLVITEVAEAVEADRKGLFGETELHKSMIEGMKGASKEAYEKWFPWYYREKVKSSREAEMADIVIRLLDFAYEEFGDKMNWLHFDFVQPLEDFCFADNADYFIEEVLGTESKAIATSVYYIFSWADKLGFDLKWHIEQKMQYNKGRSYHHGGKAY